MRSFLTAIPVAFFAAWLAVFRVTTIALASLLLILATGGFSPSSYAQAQTAAAQNDCGCWIDGKTGKPVNTIPGGSLYEDEGVLHSGYGLSGDRDHAFNPKTGQNFVRQPDGCWIDGKTGKPVNTIPGGSLYEDEGVLHSGYGLSGDRDHAFNPKTGQNFVRVPCPPPSVTTTPPTPTPTPNEKKVEACDLEFGYDYMRAPDENAKNLNGFGGSLFCNVKPWIAVGGDFSALFGSTTDTVGTSNIDVSLHRQTYLFGPQFNFYPNDKVKIFVHPLFGGVHDTTKTTIGTTTTSFSANAFAMAFGGGVDVNLNNHFAIRPIQFDYVPTHFGGQWQSNYRISTGLVIHFFGSHRVKP